ncbi:MAG: DegV family protein [Coriobacteriia bacterium]|nr:DegV family protein [Coriobacteriia bacterium]
MTVRVLTDSASYIPAEDRQRLDIRMFSMILVEGDRQTPEMDIDYNDFYARLASVDYIPTTSLPSPEEMRAHIVNILDEGYDVLGVFLPGTFSGVVATFTMVAEQLMTEDPALRGRIDVVDGESPCMEEGFAAEAAALCAQEGGTLAECAAAAEASKARSRFLFTPQTLTYLERGGRIGHASALLGGLLKLNPVLTVDNAITTTYAKVRTFPKALKTIEEKLVADIKASGGLLNICVHFIAEEKEAAEFCKNVIEPLVGFPVRVIPIGPVVGAHVGPALGIVYETVDPIAPLHGESMLERLEDALGLRSGESEESEK